MDVTLEPLDSSPTLGQRVHAALQQLIIDGRLQPGERLVETDLAERLGVSRGPVREALQGLQRQGWVDLKPRQGAFVHQPTAAEIQDFFRVRAVLEGEAARAGAENAAEEDGARLREIVAMGYDAVRGTGEGRERDMNQEFHEAVTAVAGNEFLTSLILLLGKRTRWYMAPLVGAHSQEAWDEHAAVAEAIAAGDADAAEMRMKAHVHNTRAAYERQRLAADVDDEAAVVG